MLTAPIVVVSLAQTPGAQSPTSKPTATTAKKWTPPRTSWGEPDFQGVWSYATITPLERPDGQAGKEVLSDYEYACHEGNCAIEHGLSGARNLEKAAAAVK